MKQVPVCTWPNLTRNCETLPKQGQIQCSGFVFNAELTLKQGWKTYVFTVLGLAN
jgi:hypothetical protein